MAAATSKNTRGHTRKLNPEPKTRDIRFVEVFTRCRLSDGIRSFFEGACSTMVTREHAKSRQEWNNIPLGKRCVFRRQPTWAWVCLCVLERYWGKSGNSMKSLAEITDKGRPVYQSRPWHGRDLPCWKFVAPFFNTANFLRRLTFEINGIPGHGESLFEKIVKRNRRLETRRVLAQSDWRSNDKDQSFGSLYHWSRRVESL